MSEILECYKMFVDSAHAATKQRGEANKFYVGLASSLISFVTFVSAMGFVDIHPVMFISLMTTLGLLVNLIWYFSIRSYKMLNSAKFKVIHKLEEKLSCQCYAEEWKILKRGNKVFGYQTQSYLERWLPAMFSLPYIALFVVVLVRR
ncbi:MAG: hypothetical protein D6E12_11475 [Desulfovibrio sp.]|nr:MAG: hypothetical protein D6E12_11475 [Desulfovibrio sp.]